MKTLMEPARELPIIREVDVCVIGGGPGGLTAAWQAARHGARTLLVEAYGFLGGMATAGLVGPILGLKQVGADAPTVAGITREFCESMHALGGAVDWETAVQRGGCSFDAETFKLAADRMCNETGVEVLFHTWFASSVVEGNTLRAIVVESKSGRQAIAARCFVDATGDADVAFRAGANCTKGRPADGLMMAMGSIFHVCGLADISEETRKLAAEAVTAAREAGELNVYNAGLGGHGSTLNPALHSVNATRFGGDATDVEDLSLGEMATREKIDKLLRVWRSVPGLEEVRLVASPPHIGLRETRQVVGVQRVTGQDVVDGRKCPDAVARCSYWIDIHCPRGITAGGVHLCKKSCPKSDCYMLTDHADQLPDELYPPDWFDIPYGALVPETVDNLLVSGRCISADYQAMSATRVMAPCMGIGEACGVAAALAADSYQAPRVLDVAVLREKLLAAGCIC